MRLAAASLHFDGLLVLTDERLLLLRVGTRRSGDELWAMPRRDVVTASAEGDDLRVDGRDTSVLLRSWWLPERRDELLAVLRAEQVNEK